MPKTTRLPCLSRLSKVVFHPTVSFDVLPKINGRSKQDPSPTIILRKPTFFVPGKKTYSGKWRRPLRVHRSLNFLSQVLLKEVAPEVDKLISYYRDLESKL